MRTQNAGLRARRLRPADGCTIESTSTGPSEETNFTRGAACEGTRHAGLRQAKLRPADGCAIESIGSTRSRAEGPATSSLECSPPPRGSCYLHALPCAIRGAACEAHAQELRPVDGRAIECSLTDTRRFADGGRRAGAASRDLPSAAWGGGERHALAARFILGPQPSGQTDHSRDGACEAPALFRAAGLRTAKLRTPYGVRFRFG